MASHTIPPNIVRDILAAERSPVRFEQFCCDLLSAVDGIDYLPTSRSYDLSRDGRSLPSLQTGQVGFICCGTEKDFEGKAKGDLQGLLAALLAATRPHSIIFCSNREKSEAYLQGVESQLRQLAPNVERIAAIGANQIVPLASQKHADIFERRYTAELLEHREWLNTTDIASLELQTVGMQVALTTQFQDDAQSLRKELVRTGILRSLSDGKPRTVARLAKDVSDALRLPKIIHNEYFRDGLIELAAAKLIDATEGLHSITDEGRKQYDEIVKSGNARLTNGKTLIQEAVSRLLGYELPPADFNHLWNRLRDEIANLFFANGLRLVRAIASLLANTEKLPPPPTFSELLERLRGSIIALGVGGSRKNEVAQAIVDLFSDSDSGAFNWLTELAVKYVTLCSLGLEPSAQQEISGRLRDIDLIVDTDIVLSLLSQGDRPHTAVEEVLTRWRHIGGALIVPPPVLEETAYHAWISDFEFAGLGNLLSTLRSDEIPHYVKNAFVRAFYVVAEGNYQPPRWARFISEYRGTTSTDGEKIAAILEDLGFTVITDFAPDKDFALKVSNKLYDIRKFGETAFVPKQVGDKVARDGQLIAFLRQSRQSAKHRYHTTVIISSSSTLQVAATAFSAELGEPTPVWPIGALAYLVSLIPGVSLTQSTLRTCLFEESEFESLDRLVRLALRVIRQSTSYELGYSRRSTLKRELMYEIDKAAVQRGQHPAELVEQLLEGRAGDSRLLPETIAKAVDTIAASRHEKEMEELRRKLAKPTGR